MTRSNTHGRFDFRTLLTHRILVLSNTLGKGAVRLYAQRYGVQLAEWRLLSALMIDGSGSVNGLALALGTDKGWISRTAAALFRKGLAVRVDDELDARRFQIVVTDAGRALYARILPAAVKRQNSLVSVLTDDERATLDRILEKLLCEAEKLADSTGDETPDAAPAQRIARSATKVTPDAQLVPKAGKRGK